MHSITTLLLAVPLAGALRLATAPRMMTTAIASPPASTQTAATPDAISAEAPLHVLIAGAGVGGLILANCLEMSGSPVKYTILERTKEFKKFGGPIQLASNAMQGLRSIDETLYKQIESHATWTGNRTNGIKDGIRDEWYAKFDLKTPAADRSMPFTCVVDRPDLQDVLLERGTRARCEHPHTHTHLRIASYAHTHCIYSRLLSHAHNHACAQSTRTSATARVSRPTAARATAASPPSWQTARRSTATF